MAALTSGRLANFFRPKPAPKESKRIYSYANKVYEKTGGAPPPLVKLFRVYLDSKKTR